MSTPAPSKKSPRLNTGVSHEINFVVMKFRELPSEQKARIANIIRNNEANTVPCSDAGHELLRLLIEAPGSELTDYINEKLYGEKNVIDAYFVLPNEYGVKAWLIVRYFRGHLSKEPDSFEIPDIDTVNPPLA